MSEASPLPSAIKRVLHPLADILVRQGIPHAALAEWARECFVAAAERAGGVAGRKVSTSRISVVTGLTRKEVARIRALPRDQRGSDAAARYHRGARVITGWVRHDHYSDGAGHPLVLPLEGDSPSFATLVADFAGDVPPRAVLDELEDVGAVRRPEEGLVELVVRAWIPRHEDAQKLEVLGLDVGGLLQTIAHNLDHSGDEARFQREVYYDNLPDEALPELRALTARHGQELLELLDRYMAAHDRDASPNLAGTGRNHAGIGVFYFEGSADDPSDGGSSS